MGSTPAFSRQYSAECSVIFVGRRSEERLTEGLLAVVVVDVKLVVVGVALSFARVVVIVVVLP